MGANRPQRTDTRAPSDDDEGGRVIPFPRGGRDGLRRAAEQLAFTTEIRWATGAEGEWLRRELASVIRDLLAWAHEDMADADEDIGEEQQAA